MEKTASDVMYYGEPLEDDELRDLLNEKVRKLEAVEGELSRWKSVHYEAEIAKDCFEDERINLLVDIYDIESELERRYLERE